MEQTCTPSRRRRWNGFAITLAAVASMSSLTVVSRHSAGADPDWLIFDLAVGLASCVLVPLLLRRPVTGALAMAVLAALSPAATPAATIGTLFVARRKPLPIAIGVGLAGIAAQAVQHLWRPADGIGTLWWLVLDVAVHAALVGWGAQTQARQALLDSLRERAIRAETEQGRRVAEARTAERTRMAREMHDVLAHRLSLLATYAGALEYRPDSSPEQLARAAGVIRTGAHQALDELREVIGVLRDEDLDEQPAGRPQPTFADLAGLVEESRSAGTEVTYEEAVTEPERLPPATGRTAYRVVQEGLTNARRHADGQVVRLTVDGRPGEVLRIELVNSRPAAGQERRRGGEAADPSGSGTGLVGLTERVQLAGGVLDHGEAPGGGFRLHASLPWPA